MATIPLIDEAEEQKYESVGYTQSIQTASIQINKNNEEKVIKTKNIRSFYQIDKYLQNYVPPFIDYTTIFNSIFFTIIPFCVNVFFIIDNIIILHHDKEENYQEHYLWISKNIVAYTELVGLSILALMLLVATCVRSRASIINMTIAIKSWSAFKLFYAFRPSALYVYLLTMYKQQSEHLKADIITVEQFNKLQYLCENLKQEIKDDTIDIVDKDEMMKTYRCLKKKMNSCNYIHYLEEPNQTIKERFLDRIFNAFNVAENFKKIRNIISWLIIVIVCCLLLCVGIAALILKLSQFSFINNKNILSLSITEVYFLIAFCNQLWSMSSEDQIRIDTMYKCAFMDSLKCTFSKNVSQNLSDIDSLIKTNLWKYHGVRGLLLSLRPSWKFIFKILFQDTSDPLPLSQCGKYEKTFSELHQLSSKKQKSGKLSKMKQKMATLRNKCTTYLSLKSNWKPLHPYTHSTLELRSDIVSEQKSLKNILHCIVNTDLLFVLEVMNTYLSYLIPLAYLLSTVFSVLTYIFELKHIKSWGYCSNESYVSDYGAYAVEFSTLGNLLFFISMFVVVIWMYWNRCIEKYTCKLQDSLCCCCIFSICLMLCLLVVVGALLIQVICILTIYMQGLICGFEIFAMPVLLSAYIICIYICISGLLLYVGILILIYLDVSIIVILYLVIVAITGYHPVIYVIATIYECVVLFSYPCSSAFLQNYFTWLLVTLIATYVFGLIHSIIGIKGAKSVDNWIGASVGLVLNMFAIDDAEEYLKEIEEYNIKQAISDKIMTIVMIIFWLTHLIFVILYSYVAQIWNGETKHCERMSKGIFIMSISCYLVPYGILIFIGSWRKVIRKHMFRFLSSMNVVTASIGLIAALAKARR
eukprot:264463_1